MIHYQKGKYKGQRNRGGIIMKKLPNVDKLKEVLDIAERTLNEIKYEESRTARNKKKRITKAVEKAYGCLNQNDYTEKEVEKCTNDIWASMMDNDRLVALLIFFFSFILAGISIFVVYRAYTFINGKVPSKDVQDFPHDDISNLIDVKFNDSNVIKLSNMIAISDEVGLESNAYKFTIKNDSKKITNANYAVNYSINLIPTNDSLANLIDKNYIKYKYVYTNSWTGKTYESKIGTLQELSVENDGTLNLMTGTQLKDTFSEFQVVFWLSSDAPSNQQDAEYTLTFKVEASIVRL